MSGPLTISSGEVGGASFVFFLGGAEMFGDGGDMELIYGGALLFRLLAPISGNIAEKRGFRMVSRDFRGRMREQQIFRKAALVFGNGGEALKLFGVDDGQVEASLGAVIEKDGIDDFARASGQTKGDIGDAQNSAHIRESLLDEPNAFHGFHGTADIVFVAGGAGKDQGIEDDVLGSEAVFFGEQFVTALGNFAFALASEGLGLQLVFVDAAANDGGAEIVGEGDNLLEFFLAVFQVDGIDDGLALAIGKGLHDGGGIGGVDHHRDFYFADQLFVERRNVFFLIALGALQADIDDVSAAANLAAGDFAGFLPLFIGDQVLEEARADDVGALADQQGPGAVFGFDGFDSGIDGAMRLRGALARLFAFGHLRERADVLLGGAAAAADDIEPAVVDEFLELCGERGRCLSVFAGFRIGQARIGIARNKFAGKLAERSKVIGHELGPSGAVHAKGEGFCEAQRRPHRFNRLPR